MEYCDECGTNVEVDDDGACGYCGTPLDIPDEIESIPDSYETDRDDPFRGNNMEA